MTNWGGRIALILLAGLLVHALKPKASGAVSDIMLSLAAGFIAWRFMQGYQLEKAANAETNVGKKADLKESARTLYALNGLQSPILLCAALFGCALKVFAILGEFPAVNRVLWPS